ncbi:succinyl-CoA synthetase subunit beta [candidate division TA06 bacterium DG_24]|uniref:Succinate--CoA ligase [ADP-forming] subunit beta n=3 Tax=Bacteria division TA06 TaxID=1156500 RepID=A0A0S8JKS6_UNCT6|nr:MAG: succinyl-CoA synthetase subunit beta [candidate division TA06 bacterium DG_24]KPK67710.1 MAG: succinyl-CoA synthetase subunit beta [candidate division TA06 bacterium SM23_40]KPL10372.1 MAG: succinyl-CoA synthetase subunit beta [candidate division TA06 bacterium SM1_40]
MKIHEYQAKELFARQGIPIPEGRIASTPDEAEAIARDLGRPVVVKAQVHVGGRGKAGGIKIARDPKEARQVASRILGMEIKGLVVRKVLVAEAIDIASEAYVGIIIDRKTERPVIMVSREGGIDIEEVAKKSPEKIYKLVIDPLLGLAPFQARQLAFRLYDDAATSKSAASIISKLYAAFIEVDASLAEINPLVVTGKGEVIALDAKINIDDNGLFRRKEIEAMRDLDAEAPGEVKARENGLSYIKLEGNVGCVVNGAGLAMATMDLIKRAGGEPANFLDIGGSSSPEKVTAAMEILLSDKNVRSVFFNIFGGITRCDDVAKGIILALEQMKIDLPIVIRLTGTNEEIAREILSETDLISVGSMEDGAAKAIELASEPH